VGLCRPHLPSESDDIGERDANGRARHLIFYNLNAVKNLGFF